MRDDEDVPSPRPVPRNVPTLTEVVNPDLTLHPATSAAEPAPPAHVSAPPQTATPARAAPTVAAVPTADELLQRIGPDLDRQISEAIGRVLHEQLLGLNARVRKAVSEVVHEAVVSALTQRPQGADVRENP